MSISTACIDSHPSPHLFRELSTHHVCGAQVLTSDPCRQVTSLRTASSTSDDTLRQKEEHCAQLARISEQRA